MAQMSKLFGEKMFGFISVKEHREIIANIKEDYLNKSLKATEERLEASNMIREYELSRFINKFVILVPNEMENLRVGYGLKIQHITKANNPVLEYYDIMKKENFISMGKVFMFSEQKFNGLNKLEPNERIALFYAEHVQEEINKNETRKEEIEPYQSWAEKVFLEIENFKKSDLYMESQKNIGKVELDFEPLN